MTPDANAVDEVLPARTLFAAGLQHVLVMYAGAIAVPLIVGGAIGLPKDQLAFLIDADLFAAGIATLLQCVGFRGVGIRLPVMMGVSFASVGPMLAMVASHTGLPAMYGAIIVSGAAAVAVAPAFGTLLRFFPPIVTGTIITTIGLTLLQVGIAWAGGGFGSPTFGAPVDLGLAAIVLLAILAINRYASGFLANIAVLLGLVIGFVVAIPLGFVNFAGLGDAPWVAFVEPFRFGLPVFDLNAIVSFCIVMIVVLVESTGVFLALGETCGRPVTPATLTAGLRADGLGALIGGIFNTFPYTTFSQNAGLVGITGVRSRWVVAAAGGILIVLGLVPKLATIVASIPPAVLGGAGIAMFGTVAAAGIKILQRVDFGGRSNLLIVAVSIGVGMIPVVTPTFFDHWPGWTGPLTHSGITLTAIVAVALNAAFNGAVRGAEPELAVAEIAV
jgi:NCS2 family nucleobase:cation symporter-2